MSSLFPYTFEIQAATPDLEASAWSLCRGGSRFQRKIPLPETMLAKHRADRSPKKKKKINLRILHGGFRVWEVSKTGQAPINPIKRMEAWPLFSLLQDCRHSRRHSLLGEGRITVQDPQEIPGFLGRSWEATLVKCPLVWSP